MSNFTTIPAFKIPYNGKEVEVHMTDFKHIATCMIVSPDFLNALAEHDKPIIRTVPAEHANTPKATLVKLLKDESPLVYFAALENPQTPFESVLYRWVKSLPDGTIWDSPAVTDRHGDVLEFLKKYNITEEESRTLPVLWIVKTLENLN